MYLLDLSGRGASCNRCNNITVLDVQGVRDM